MRRTQSCRVRHRAKDRTSDSRQLARTRSQEVPTRRSLQVIWGATEKPYMHPQASRGVPRAWVRRSILVWPVSCICRITCAWTTLSWLQLLASLFISIQTIRLTSCKQDVVVKLMAFVSNDLHTTWYLVLHMAEMWAYMFQPHMSCFRCLVMLPDNSDASAHCMRNYSGTIR